MRLETILCIENAVAARMLSGVGFLPIESVDLSSLLSPRHAWFAPRASIEERPEFRQLIPYIVLRCGGAIVTYQRTRKGGEARLHDNISLGFGGHVGLDDVVLKGALIDLEATLQRAAQREVQEEVADITVAQRRRIGLIYADDDAVSRVHLGIVELWDITDASVASAESAITGCCLTPVERLSALAPQMEGWSRLCLPTLALR